VRVIKRLSLIVLLAGLGLLCSCGDNNSENQKHAAAASPSTALPASPVELVTKSGVEMVCLPGGQFTMGTSQGEADEGPAHKVTLTGFMIDKFPVTHEMFTKAQVPNPSHWQDNPKKPV
jgi:formylglycine-generating enzyme required for sulfatase activity